MLVCKVYWKKSNLDYQALFPAYTDIFNVLDLNEKGQDLPSGSNSLMKNGQACN